MSVRISTLFFSGLALCLCGIFYVTLPPAYQSSNTSRLESCDCLPKNTNSDRSFKSPMNLSYKFRSGPFKDNHNLAILVPFRDRFEELLEFAPSISSFLNYHKKNHHIFIINQVDSLRFNRAALINVGFLEIPVEFDYIALHDVDLIPTNPDLLYSFPAEGPFHVSAPHLHPRYHYPTFIGGILLIRRDHFRKADGMSNKYWGWGLEDDEFYARLKEMNLKVFRPANLSTGIKNTFRHIHDRRVRKRDMVKCYNQQEITRRRDRQTGLSSIKYLILSRKQITIEGSPLTILNIELEYDFSVTPWCNCTQNVGNTQRNINHYKDRTDVIVPKVNRKKHLSPGG